MSDQLENALDPLAEEQPLETPIGSGEPGADQGAVTRADLSAFKGEIQAMLEDNIGRIKQSLTSRDKTIRDDIDKRVKAYLEVAEPAGLSEATKGQQIEQIRADVVKRHMDTTGLPAQGPAGVQPQPPDPEEIERMLTGLYQYQAETGVVLTPMDQEYQKVLALGDNPPTADYDKTFRQAMAAKAKRIGKAIPPQPGASSAARSAATVGGAQVGDRMEQLNKRLNEIQAADPFRKDRTLTIERKKILEEMEPRLKGKL